MHNLLDDYFTEPQLCEQLNVKPRTTRQWRTERKGPPVTYLRGRPHYRKSAAREWLLALEGKAARHECI